MFKKKKKKKRPIPPSPHRHDVIYGNPQRSKLSAIDCWGSMAGYEMIQSDLIVYVSIV